MNDALARIVARHKLPEEAAAEINDLLADEKRKSSRAGYEEGYRGAASLTDLTVSNLQLGISLLASDPPSADVYLDRAFKDLNCGGFHKGRPL